MKIITWPLFRTATVVCREETILGVLSRQQYNKILCNFKSLADVDFSWSFCDLVKLYEKRDERDLQFLRDFGIFSHLSNDRLREIFLQLDKAVFRKNNRLYQEGDNPDKVYFIRNGEIEVAIYLGNIELIDTIK